MADVTTDLKTQNLNSEIAKDVIHQFERLRNLRANFDEHWRQVAERVLPVEKFAFNSGITSNKSRGEERNERMFDSTASIALGRFASIMDSLLTPRNSTWHRLRVSNPELQKNREVRMWFDEVTEIFFKFRYTPSANFASQNQKIFESVGAFGNGPMFIDELVTEPGIRYKAVSLGGVYLTENHQGLIDGLIRHFTMTARQIVQKWPDTAPVKMKEMTDKGGKSSENEFEMLHCIKPREDVNINRRDFRGMPHVSYYVQIDGAALLEEGGFRSFPYAVARARQASDEVYGRGPAMEVLPAIKTLNEQKKTVLKQGHRITDPVLLGYDDGLASRFSMRPGAYNVGGVSKEGRLLVHTLPTGNLAVGKDMMDDERNDIKDVFLNTLFQILVESPTRTATEVLERVKEKGVLLAPAFGKIESEYLGPGIEREFDVLANQGLLPEMPQILIEAQGEFTIIYDSPFSRAQRAEEAAGLMRVLEFSINLATQTGDVSILDHFDNDIIIPEVAHIQGLPERWLRGQDAIAAIRAQRQAQQQAEAANRAAPGAAALIKSAAVASEKAPEAAQAAIEQAG